MSEDTTPTDVVDPADEVDEAYHEEHRPVGTLFVMAMFWLMVIAMWVWMFATLIRQGE